MKKVKPQPSPSNKVLFPGFLARARAIHGSSYEYSEESFTGMRNFIEIVCKVHGAFTQRAGSHVNKGYGCPSCGILKRAQTKRIKLPEFLQRASEIHGSAYTYDKVALESMSGKILVTCPSHGDFSQVAASHLQGSGCPKCAIAKRSEAARLTFEDVVLKSRDVHGNAYTYIKDSFKGYSSHMEILCPIHGSFLQTPNTHISAKSRCPQCSLASSSRLRALTFEEFKTRSEEVHESKYTYVQDSYVKASDYLTIVCPEHGEFSQFGSDHLAGSGCSKCTHRMSKGEAELLKFAESLGVEVQGSYRYQGSREFDVFFPQHNLAVEFDGLLWHSTRYRDKASQAMKTEDAKRLGVDLIRVFQDEWIARRTQVEAFIKSRLGILDLPRVYARKCEVREVDNTTARSFYDENHVQGWRRYGTNLGLFYQDKVVALMTFTSTLSSRKKAQAGEVELARYATNAQVVGGAGKLLKAYIRKYTPKLVVSYSDKRMFSGEMYNKLGFTKVADLPPTYTYFRPSWKSIERHHKSKFQRKHLQQLMGEDFNPDLSERENAELAGFYQIYDDGKIRWELRP